MPRVLVIYDISDDSKRLRASRMLQAWGLSRIQRSAFTGVMQRARVRDLARGLERVVDESTDIVHILAIDQREWERAIVIGKPLWSGGATGALLEVL